MSPSVATSLAACLAALATLRQTFPYIRLQLCSCSSSHRARYWSTAPRPATNQRSVSAYNQPLKPPTSIAVICISCTVSLNPRDLLVNLRIIRKHVSCTTTEAVCDGAWYSAGRTEILIANERAGINLRAAEAEL